MTLKLPQQMTLNLPFLLLLNLSIFPLTLLLLAVLHFLFNENQKTKRKLMPFTRGVGAPVPSPVSLSMCPYEGQSPPPAGVIWSCDVVCVVAMVVEDVGSFLFPHHHFFEKSMKILLQKNLNIIPKLKLNSKVSI